MSKGKHPTIRLSAVVMIAYLAFLLVPIYWLVIMSFKSNSEILSMFTLFPENFTLKNYQTSLTDPSWYMGYVNSFIYVSMNTVISLRDQCQRPVKSHDIDLRSWIISAFSFR